MTICLGTFADVCSQLKRVSLSGYIVPDLWSAPVRRRRSPGTYTDDTELLYESRYVHACVRVKSRHIGVITLDNGHSRQLVVPAVCGVAVGRAGLFSD